MTAVAAPPMMRLTPRPYQHEAVAALLAAAARGVQRPLLVLPTGTGKTIIFALLVQRRGGRALILAHRDELIQQAVDKLHLVDPTLSLGIVQAAHDELTAPTVVASVQTLSRRTRLARLVPDFQTIVIDEAHHAPAPTYRRILEYCCACHRVYLLREYRRWQNRYWWNWGQEIPEDLRFEPYTPPVCPWIAGA